MGNLDTSNYNLLSTTATKEYLVNTSQ